MLTPAIRAILKISWFGGELARESAKFYRYFNVLATPTLSLALFVSRISADHANHATAFDDLAVAAHLFH
jgi:hypothetical protein